MTSDKAVNSLVVYGLVAVALLSVLAAASDALKSGPVQAAAAQAAQARAGLLAAQVDSERAAAARAWSAAAVDDLTIAARARALSTVYFFMAGAVGLSTLGGAVVGLAWLQRRASVIYPDGRGRWPIVIERQRDGSIALLDSGRMVSPMMLLTQHGELVGQAVDDGRQVQQNALAAQAAVLTAFVPVGGAPGAGAAVENRIADTASAVLPSFASDKASVPVLTAPGGDGGQAVRFVYVNGGRGPAVATTEGGAPGELPADLLELREFILQSKVRGLARRAWSGFTFATGRKCSRDRWEDLMGQIKKAGAVVEDGTSWKIADPGAALRAFGLQGEADENL